MFDFANTIIGLLCLAGGVALAFFWPLGRRTGEHLLFNVIIVALFVIAAYNLTTKDMVSDDTTVIVIGLAAGGLAVLIRSVRRWLKYFQGVVSRRTSPYYWYRRAFTRRRR